MARPPETARQTPRMSANDLALYIVSSETARLGIIKRAKYPQIPPIIRYSDVRPVVCAYLSDQGRRVNPLIAAQEMFEQRAEDPSMSVLRQDDAKNSIEVLHAIQRMSNRLNSFEFTHAPKQQAKLILAAVEISVRADLLVKGQLRRQPHSGVAVLRLTQDDADSEMAKARRKEMGSCVATLARLHVEQNLGHEFPLSNRFCMSIDVQHGDFFQAPDSNTRRMNDLENACRFIAAVWDSV